MPDRTSSPACWCCGEPASIRGEGDLWEGRLDGYCVSCATTRCDTTDSTCAVKGRAKGESAAPVQDSEVDAVLTIMRGYGRPLGPSGVVLGTAVVTPENYSRVRLVMDAAERRGLLRVKHPATDRLDEPIYEVVA